MRRKKTDRNNANEANIYKEVGPRNYRLKTNLSFDLLVVRMKRETFHRFRMNN